MTQQSTCLENVDISFSTHDTYQIKDGKRNNIQVFGRLKAKELKQHPPSLPMSELD